MAIEENPKYRKYLLTNNPFPEIADIDPSNRDIRYSGDIFNERVFAEELKELSARINKRVNVIYVTGGGWERGVGKSAVVIHQWKKLLAETNATAAYVRASNRSRPIDFCNKIVLQWHEKGYLWRAFRNFLDLYKTSSSPRISSDKIDSLLTTYRNMPESVQLRVFTFDSTERVASDMAKFAQEKADTIRQVVNAFFETYLSRPPEFPERYDELKVKGYDEISFFDTFVRLLTLSKLGFHYVIIDQFEDAVRGNKKQIGDFCTEMRRILMSCAKLGLILVTLHPESEEILNGRGGEHFVGLANIDDRHTVDIRTLAPEEAAQLAATYIDNFRAGSPKHRLYPFDEDAVKYIGYRRNGIARDILQTLHVAIEEGIDAGYPEIDMDFIRRKHRRILGTEFMPDKLKEFERI